MSHHHPSRGAAGVVAAIMAKANRRRRKKTRTKTALGPVGLGQKVIGINGMASSGGARSSKIASAPINLLHHNFLPFQEIIWT